MFNSKKISTKLTLLSTAAIMTASLFNVQTAYGAVTPGENAYAVRPSTPVPGNQVRPNPTPPRPQPGQPVRPNPNPVRPTPTPVRPNPPGPVRPMPPPVRPEPVRPLPPRPIPRPIPIPVPTPYPPINYTQYQSVSVNKFVVGNEVLYLNQVANSNYFYAGYRLRSIRMDVSGDANLSATLLLNGQVIDSRYTSGEDLYLYPNYYVNNLNALTVNFSGYGFIHSMTLEYQRYY